MKRLALMIVLAIFLNGCAMTQAWNSAMDNMAASKRTYDTPEETKQYITEEYDDFTNARRIIGPGVYFNKALNWQSWALIRSWPKSQQHQVYVRAMYGDWRFFNRAVWSNGDACDFTEIDRDTYMGQYGVSVIETVGIDLPHSKLEELAETNQPVRIRVYGKRGNQDVSLPASYVRGYWQYISEQ